MELASLRNGEQGMVSGIFVDEKLKNRLKMCNLQVGKKVKCIRHAPCGGIMVECDGICLGLRRELAKGIMLCKVQADA